MFYSEDRMKKAYVSLGGNLGFPLITIKKALEEICLLKDISDFRRSSFYETEPVSSLPQGFFINAVCTFKTSMTPEELLFNLQTIEGKLGKVPKAKDAPRIIDLDLLFLGQEVRRTDQLTLPHPEWNKRLFVLQPLLDLTEEIILKENDKFVSINIRKLVESLTPSTKVRALE